MIERQAQIIPSEIDQLSTKLVRLALQGLPPLYDEQQKLFVYKMDQGQRVATPLASTITYTAITLLGLRRARQGGWNGVAINEAETLEALVQYVEKIPRPGDLGLILWADAHCEGRHKRLLVEAIKPQSQASTLAQLPTMELAWLLIGFCYTQQRSGAEGETEKLALTFYEAVKSRFNPKTGLFCHRQEGTWPARIRNQIGNFADQIYSVYALSLFYEVFGSPEALQGALQCARQLCAFQGEQGQWWWHYQARQGVVASFYPVFAVHQDGMAPMALLKLAAVSQQSFQPAIQRGLRWLFGQNELGVEMVDWQRDLIWRDIELARPISPLRYLSMGLADLGLTGVTRRLNALPMRRVNYEMRSYELGWLLYAFSERTFFE